MNFTMTMVAQSVTFAVFIWFCVRFIWPPLINAMRERQKTIAEGIENAEKAEHDLAEAGLRAQEAIKNARTEADQIIAQARRQSSTMIEEAKREASEEGERIVQAAQAEIDQEVNRARERLREEVAGIAVSGAERILEEEIDRDKHADLLKKLAAEL
ncbi:MAG: F0F1 ATP synthase subunit B [Gammaproteobacteria bacterium]|nr:F0F1 ATP synthase subunit B [Gammaproteobacteria bacterium]